MAGWTIALGVSSCSLVLDWSGYTGGDSRGSDADDEASHDANAAMDATDAIDHLDAANDLDTTERFDASGAAALDAAPPCSPKNCGGCCNSNGFCAGGASGATCGTDGKACRDCASMGQSCDQGVCSSVDSGPAPTCDDAQCRNMITLCIPAYQGGCCLPDGTCGCQVLIPSMGKCM
jgi:hypothetical protein